MLALPFDRCVEHLSELVIVHRSNHLAGRKSDGVRALASGQVENEAHIVRQFQVTLFAQQSLDQYVIRF